MVWKMVEICVIVAIRLRKHVADSPGARLASLPQSWPLINETGPSLRCFEKPALVLV